MPRNPRNEKVKLSKPYPVMNSRCGIQTFDNNKPINLQLRLKKNKGCNSNQGCNNLNLLNIANCKKN